MCRGGVGGGSCFVSYWSLLHGRGARFPVPTSWLDSRFGGPSFAAGTPHLWASFMAVPRYCGPSFVAKYPNPFEGGGPASGRELFAVCAGHIKPKWLRDQQVLFAFSCLSWPYLVIPRFIRPRPGPPNHDGPIQTWKPYLSMESCWSFCHHLSPPHTPTCPLPLLLCISSFSFVCLSFQLVIARKPQGAASRQGFSGRPPVGKATPISRGVSIASLLVLHGTVVVAPFSITSK